jgi:nicotinate dehydrogenase subunit B
MNAVGKSGPSRRAVLAGGGCLLLSFSCLSSGAVLAQQGEVKLPGSLGGAPLLDSWIRIDADGITVFTGKAELGQGIRTAIMQVAAEELGLEPEDIILITADTQLTPDEGVTAGSNSMKNSATAVRHAAAQVREILMDLAAERLDVPRETLTAKEASIVTPDGRRIEYLDLIGGDTLHRAAQAKSTFIRPDAYRVIGQDIPRVDIPAKVTGGEAYVQDLRLPDMVHARVIRPPSYDARLRDLDEGAVSGLPGLLKIVRDGRFLAVVAEKEFQAIRAMRRLATAATWDEPKNLPGRGRIFEHIAQMATQDLPIFEKPATGATGKTLEAAFRRPYQMHASIGPSCAVALWQDDKMTVWTHSQGVYPLRDALGELLSLDKEDIRCIHMEGSGCYGHNGADDVAADSALIAHRLPGRPVRVQWMREQEHQWEPYGSAMLTKMKATLDDSGKIVDWTYEVVSATHSTRPSGNAGNLLAGRHVSQPFTMPTPKPSPQPDGGGDRNAIPLYRIPGGRILNRFQPEMPLRVSALRGLGAYMNVFSIESFMDDLAEAAGTDPVTFRLDHLDDSRARDVITKAAERFGWKNRIDGNGRGSGLAFARYKNSATYLAVAMEVEVERETGRIRPLRVAAAVDSGEAVSPDGIRNQTEGGIIQAISWTLYESVSFDETRVLSLDWGAYPILRFPALPRSVVVDVINRPGEPFLGAGEAAQGPAAAALNNAVRAATGKRFREIPLTPARVKATLRA